MGGNLLEKRRETRKKLLKRKILLGLNKIRPCPFLWFQDKRRGKEIYGIIKQESKGRGDGNWSTCDSPL
jgi:hypothetical protein